MSKKQKIIITISIMLIFIIISTIIFLNYKPDTEADSQFKTNLTFCEYKIHPILENIKNSAEDYDISSVQYWCGQLKITANACIKLITYEEWGEISFKYSSVKTEYLAYLNDLYYAGYYGELGDLDKYIEYYEQSVVHHSKCIIN